MVDLIKELPVREVEDRILGALRVQEMQLGEIVGLLLSTNHRIDRLMANFEDFQAAQVKMASELKDLLSSRAQAIKDAVAQAEAAVEAKDQAQWDQALSSIKDATSQIESAGANIDPNASMHSPTDQPASSGAQPAQDTAAPAGAPSLTTG